MERPPLGVTPRWAWLEERMVELFQAIMRYRKAGLPVNPDWIREFQEIKTQQQTLPDFITDIDIDE
jgi:hypothetical protein